MDEFASSDQFKLLEFGGNRISQIPLAWNCSQLEELWLAGNELSFDRIDFTSCPKLRILALQSNKFTNHLVIHLPSSLKELWLSQNEITSLEIGGNCPLIELKTLDLSDNSLKMLPTNLPHISPNFTDLDIKGNGIKDLSCLLGTLQQMPRLAQLKISDNPAVNEGGASTISRISHSISTWKSPQVKVQDLPQISTLSN